MPTLLSNSRDSNVKRCSPSKPCKQCARDQAFLRATRRPRRVAERTSITAVDLFAGCGGMTVGLQEAARRAASGLKISLAVDSDSAAIGIYKANFPEAETEVGDVSVLFDGVV